MTRELIPFGFFLFFIIVFFFSNYNKFIKYKNLVEASWSKIDVALKRRSNLIPALAKLVAQFQKHEAEVFEKAGERFGRPAEDLSERSEEESRLTRSFSGVLAVAEHYPELRSSENFLALQEALAENEKDIMNARDRFNDHIASYNTLVDAYPTKWIAGWYGFEKYDYFNLELATQREMPSVDLDQTS